jgi:DNA-directed RNA polymerase subunit E'/Rpb7
MDVTNIFEEGLIQRDIEITINELDNIPTMKFHDNLKKYIENKINLQIGGKCIEDGYIKPNSISVTGVSTGEVRHALIRYSVLCACRISCPTEGMIVECIAQTITNGGIKASVAEYPNDSPMIIFIAKELTMSSAKPILENDVFKAKIIGVHFELNDTYVSVIAKLV